MQGDFNTSAASSAETGQGRRSQAERALGDWGIEYRKQPDGSLLVPGEIDISDRRLDKLPDLSRVKVGGSFSCSDNRLTSLKGAPQDVGGNFRCEGNRLITLAGAPRAVGFSFFCQRNELISLEGAPQTVGGGFSCGDNQLTSLEHAPATFRMLESDFGDFKSWDDAPEHLRLSPATKARLEQERQAAIEKTIQEATVLQVSVAVTSPLRFKRSASPA